ncbi:hypothetical protein TWF970_005604 [Orbilia oligospora]|uniref:Uncharacterized protein n=1 Tax=Orbilia oligospora TaxID=2813651 RepID=A0A7C8VIH7_ORBOL|nr:hypothetical protein TWF970_005604 [Orbilia oligospora]
MSLHSLYTEPHHPLPKGLLVKKRKTIKTGNTSNSDETSFSVHIQRHRLPRPATTNEPRHTSPTVMRKFMDCMNNLSCFGAGADRPINPNNDGATMNSNNIVPLDVPIGHLEPFETRPVVKLPALPDIKNRKVLREILKVDKKMRDKVEGHSPNQNGVFNDSSGSRFMKAFLKSKLEEPSYARTGVIIMDEVLEDIIGSKGADLEYNLQEQIKQSFLTDNQAHYFAICYRMEQHIHHYGDWGAVTTKELADVFRGYIGALSSENEIGLKGVHIWLHKLLGKAVINEIEYASWTEKHARQAARMAREGSQYEFDGLSFGLGDGHSAEF